MEGGVGGQQKVCSLMEFRGRGGRVADQMIGPHTHGGDEGRWTLGCPTRGARWCSRCCRRCMCSKLWDVRINIGPV